MARGPRLQRRHRRQGLERRGGATGQTAPRHGRKNRKTWKLRGKVGGSRGEPCPVGAEQRTGSINASRGVQRHLADRRSEQIGQGSRSEEHTSEIQSLMRSSYAVFCLKKKKKHIIQSKQH